MDRAPFACPANTGRPRVVETGQGIRAAVELDVDVVDIMDRRPFNCVLEPKAAPDVDPDPVPQRDRIFSRGLPNPITSPRSGQAAT